MSWTEIKAWRRMARQKLLAARVAIAPPERAALAQRLMERLEPVLKTRPAPISFYWPIKAEPDLRPLMRKLDQAGVAVCLPVATKLGEPLRFRPWHRGCQMERGFWDIPVPADPTEVAPRTLIAPIVGYAADHAGRYRLGYGGGFFDRTLSKLGKDASAIGIGYSMFALETIHPQPHDVPMTALVTERDGDGGEDNPPASEVCYLEEAVDAYAGFAAPEEIAAALASIRPGLAPERLGLADYALWRLGVDETSAPSAAEPVDAVLDALLPRIRDDAIHAAVTALRRSL